MSDSDYFIRSRSLNYKQFLDIIRFIPEYRHLLNIFPKCISRLVLSFNYFG